MKSSIMASKIKKPLLFITAIIILLVIWHIAAVIIDDNFVLPSIEKTFSALIEVLSDGTSFLLILGTISRVVLALIIGFILGALLGYLSYKFESFALIITPMLSIIKSTPIASIIILFWFVIDGYSLPILVSVLMILPLVCENVTAGFRAIDPKLIEVCSVFDLSPITRFRILIFPSVVRYVAPVLITSIGITWKAEVAAEIIGYVSNSIGSAINDARSSFISRDVFAWTVIIIILSMLLEQLTKYLLRRVIK